MDRIDIIKEKLGQRRRNERQITALRRTAKEVRHYRVNIRLLTIILVMLLIFTMAIYIVAVLYRNSGRFSVSLDKYEMTQFGLSLSESREMTHMTSHLNAKISEKMTNISEKSISPNVGMIDGEHNGRDYIAYTFYLQNAGEHEVTYDYNVIMSNVTNGLDEAIRLRLYVNDVPTTYAKTRSDGKGPEPGTKEFYSNDIMTNGRIYNLPAGGVTKYTIVLWLEGNDPDCIDWLIGGTIKIEMKMSVAQ